MRIKELVQQLKDWFVDAATRRTDRPWCTFGITAPFTVDKIAKVFDSSESIDKYVWQYNNRDYATKKAHTYLQVEINMIYGMKKAFVARHRTRMQFYRDDSSQKAYHCRRAIEKAFTKFDTLLTKSE